MPLMPAIFFGHGNPMNAVSQNRYTEAWSRLGREVRRPQAILCISAHWYTNQTGVTITTSPRTIHDFSGFPRELYRVQYPAPGDPDLARRVQALLAPLPVQLDESWGLDHGAWSVLTHVYPAADIAVVELSIDASQPASFHYEIGRRIAPLRDENILIAGSGNLVHNLRAMDWSGQTAGPYDWAARFEEQARLMILAGEHKPLIAYQKLGSDALLAAPTPDHFLPLMHVLGAQQSADRVTFPVEGAEGGSISMLAVKIGG
ncbi:MAG TPA: 4,5-DOPA dioxygenase extradiol [Bryobacteraceae bacterium]|jgi:4,5-DOPA dioxygenase extradiol